MWKRDLDPRLVERPFDLLLDRVPQLEEALAQRPGGELHLHGRVAEALHDEDRLWLVETEGVAIGELEEQIPNALHVLAVGDTDLQVEASDGELVQGADLGFEQRFVRDPDEQVVERSQLDRQ